MTSYSGQGIDLPLSASGDLNSYQYRFVALTSNRKVLGATGASNPTPFGVLQNDPRDGEGATVRVGGLSLIYAEAVTPINVGTPLISGSTGMAKPALVSSSAVSAVALEALASGTGILIEALIIPFSAPSAS